MPTAYIVIYSVTKNLPALPPQCSPAAAAPWVRAMVPLVRLCQNLQHLGLRVCSNFVLDSDQADATVWPVAWSAASIVACSCQWLVLCKEVGLASWQPLLAPHAYVALHTRHFMIQLQVEVVQFLAFHDSTWSCLSLSWESLARTLRLAQAMTIRRAARLRATVTTNCQHGM